MKKEAKQSHAHVLVLLEKNHAKTAAISLSGRKIEGLATFAPEIVRLRILNVKLYSGLRYNKSHSATATV
jgi:hypothetical protein